MTPDISGSATKRAAWTFSALCGRHIGSSQGLVENPVLSVLDDGNGVLWLKHDPRTAESSTRTNAQRGRRKEKRPRCRLLGKSDGMRSSECGGPDRSRGKPHQRRRSLVRHRQRFRAYESICTAAPLLRLNRASLVSDRQRGSSTHRKSCPQVRTRQLPDSTSMRYELANPRNSSFVNKLDGYDRAMDHLVAPRSALSKSSAWHLSLFSSPPVTKGHDWGNPVEQVTVVQRPFF